MIGNATGTVARYRLVLENPVVDTAKLDGIAAGAGQPKPGVPFSTSETILDAHHGNRREWVGTTAGRITVPNGLEEGRVFEYTSRTNTANLAPLTIERASADGNRRSGEAIGCSLLRPGGLVRIRSEADMPRIEGDLDPSPMVVQNGGASVLLERGLKQTLSGTIINAWGDDYGLHNFDTIAGAPIVASTGAVVFVPDPGVSVRMRSLSTFQYAGAKLLFGFAGMIHSRSGTNLDWLNFLDFTNGNGFRARVHDNSLNMTWSAMTNAGAETTLFSTAYQLNRPIAGGIVINRVDHRVVGFFDEGYSDRIIQKIIAGPAIAFTSNWTTAPTPFHALGPALTGVQSLISRYYAVNIRDNVAFASFEDERDQARAMLAEMRGYYA